MNIRTATHRRRAFAAVIMPAIAAVAVALLTGCESADDASGDYWKEKAKKASGSTSASTTTTSSSQASATSAADEVEPGGGADEVNFFSLNWEFGGINCGRAAKTSATISGLTANSQMMTYRWAGDTLRSWGLSDGDASALACFFVQRSDGTWVGGKFDWISTSRTSREFKHIYDGYNGWSLRGVPNPCACAFVIVSGNGAKRTNVITTTWHR